MDKFLGQDIPEGTVAVPSGQCRCSRENRLHPPIYTRRIGAKERNISRGINHNQ